MIIVKLANGLGNQMFQYAFARSIAEDLGTEFLLDCGFFDDNFNWRY